MLRAGSSRFSPRTVRASPRSRRAARPGAMEPAARLSSSDRLRFAAYGGNRQVEQFLAFSGAGALASGGVVNLDRHYYGLDLRWSRATELAGRPLALTVGSDYDNQKERRRGYTNNNGTAGPLQRDEDDTARSAALYA